MEGFEGNYARRQAAPCALRAQPAHAKTCVSANRAHCIAPRLHVVNQQTGVPAACAAEHREHGLQPRAHFRDARIGIGHGARRAYGRASAAACAKMRFDLHVIAIRADRAGRAHVQALGAAGLAGARVGANPFAVLREARFGKLTHHRPEALRGERLLQRISARRGVALGQVWKVDERPARKIQHQVEALLARRCLARKINRTDRAAGLHAFAVRLAFLQVDLVAEVDRAFRARTHARIAARAQVKVDRIVLQPLHLERAEPAGNTGDFSRPDGVAALGWLLSLAFGGEQYAYVKRSGKPSCPVERCIRRPDDQQPAIGHVIHLRHRFRLRKSSRRKQRRDLGSRVLALCGPAGGFANVEE